MTHVVRVFNELYIVCMCSIYKILFNTLTSTTQRERTLLMCINGLITNGGHVFFYFKKSDDINSWKKLKREI